MEPLIAVDHFYGRPHRVRRRAESIGYTEPEDLTGWRSKRGFFPRGVISRLRGIAGRNIALDPPEGTPYDNGAFFQAFAEGRRSETPGVHYDDPVDHMICLVYLTPDIPARCGTSFFRHKRTGLETAPTRLDARRLDTPIADLRDRLERDSCHRDRWREIDRVGYRFNRAVIFPARRLHAATRHFGHDVNDGRIYQLFRFRYT